MLGLLGVLIIGLIVGAIAKLIVPGKEPGGCLVTSAIGVNYWKRNYKACAMKRAPVTPYMACVR